MKRKIFSIFFALVLVLSFSLVTAVPTAADELPVGPSPKYPTIQSAIDAAGPDDTILVEPGIYDESINIPSGKDGLKILGAGKDTTTISSTTSPAATVIVVGSPVTISGFTIEGSKASSPNETIRIDASGSAESPGVIEGNRIEGLFPAPYASVAFNISNNVGCWEIAGNEFTASVTGIAFNKSHNITVSGNTFIDYVAACGSTEDTIDVTITDNHFLGSNEAGSEAIGIGTGATNLAIQSNRIEGNANGIKVYGTSSVNVSGNTFTNNDVQVSDEPGVLNIEDVLANNIFDRAVVVRGSPIVVPIIFSSIQDAVNAAVPGDTVSVLPGTYEIIHSIDILTDDLAILGANHDVNPVTNLGARGDESIVKLMACTYAFWVKDADFVIIAGFTIDATESGENHGYPDEGHTSLGVGIGPTGSGEPSADDATVSNNIIFGTSDYAIGCYAANTPSSMIYRAQVLNNSIYDCKDGFTGGVGLSQSLIQGNMIVGSYNAGEWGAITFYGNINTTSILGNTIAGSVPAGICLGGGNYTQLTIAQNDILGNDGPGVWVSSGASLDEGSSIQFNNLVGNSYGVLVSGSPTVDARYNWWGDISGPNCETGYHGTGDKVSNGVTFEPWLTREFQQVLAENIAYYGYAWVAPDYGWNLLSTPIALDPLIDTWGEYVKLGDGLAISSVETNYYFDGEIQWYVQVLGDYQLKPCDAIIVNMLEADIHAILYSPEFSVPSKDLVAGLNLVSLSSARHSMPAPEALATIEEVTGGLKGYAQVISPNMNQPYWTYVPGVPDGDPAMFRTKGYWVFMTNDGTLLGFEFTPQTLGPSGDGSR